MRSLIDKLRKYDQACKAERAEMRKSVQIVNRKLQEYNKIQYKRHKKNTSYKIGDLVLVKVLYHKPSTNIKLTLKFKGSYQIKTVLKKNR